MLVLITAECIVHTALLYTQSGHWDRAILATKVSDTTHTVIEWEARIVTAVRRFSK